MLLECHHLPFNKSMLLFLHFAQTTLKVMDGWPDGRIMSPQYERCIPKLAQTASILSAFLLSDRKPNKQTTTQSCCIDGIVRRSQQQQNSVSSSLQKWNQCWYQNKNKSKNTHCHLRDSLGCKSTIDNAYNVTLTFSLLLSTSLRRWLPPNHSAMNFYKYESNLICRFVLVSRKRNKKWGDDINVMETS